MSPFEYLSVLFSIVMGLALTNLLGAVARLMHARSRVQLYWPPLVWALIIFMIIVQHWWAEFSLRHVHDWNFGGFISVLVPPTLLYLLSDLVLPHHYDDERIDLYAWFYGNRRWFFGIFAILPAWSIVEQSLLFGSIQSASETVFLTIFTCCSLIGVMFRSPRLHEIFCVAIGILFATFIALLFHSLPT